MYSQSKKDAAHQTSPSCVCSESSFPSALFGGMLAVDGETPLPPALPIRRDASSFGMRRIGAQLEFLWHDDDPFACSLHDDDIQAEAKVPPLAISQYLHASGAAA